MSKQKKARQKLDVKKFDPAPQEVKKKEKDWGFDEILRSKTRHR